MLRTLDAADTVVTTSNPFVQHMTLDPMEAGKDNDGYVVRAKDGLAGCEYLSEVPLVKPGANFMNQSTSS